MLLFFVLSDTDRPVRLKDHEHEIVIALQSPIQSVSDCHVIVFLASTFQRLG